MLLLFSTYTIQLLEGLLKCIPSTTAAWQAARGSLSPVVPATPTHIAPCCLPPLALLLPAPYPHLPPHIACPLCHCLPFCHSFSSNPQLGLPPPLLLLWPGQGPEQACAPRPGPKQRRAGAVTGAGARRRRVKAVALMPRSGWR